MTGVSDWTGTVGDVWAAEWRRTDRSFADLSRHIDAAILAAAPEGPFRALDIGCGAGGTSLSLAATRRDATILGVDLSAGLVKVARDRFVADAPARLQDGPTASPPVLPRRREPRATSDDLSYPGLPPAREHGVATGEVPFDDHDATIDEDGLDPSVLRRRPERWLSSADQSPTLRPAPKYERPSGELRFEIGDAMQVGTTARPFHLLYSRHGVMFFDDPIAAFTTLHAAAEPGAQLIFSCFADWSQNAFAKAIADALDLPPPQPRAPGPFAFADENYVADILGKAGWTNAHPTRVPFTYRAGEGEGDAAIADALSFFQRIGPAAGPLRAAAPADRAVMLDRLTGVLRAHRVGNAIDFPALAWIWSATA